MNIMHNNNTFDVGKDIVKLARISVDDLKGWDSNK